MTPTTCREWPPPRAALALAVAIPGSILSVEQGLRMKTMKAGLIARALSVYRVDEVIVYRDADTAEGDAELLALLLEYAETPPHLRKLLHPLRPELRYAGLLPPLRTPPHDPPEKPVRGALVEGVVTRRWGDSCRVYLGRLGSWLLRPCRHEKGSRVTVRIVDPSSRRVEEHGWDGLYSGYGVKRARSLEEAVKWGRASGRLVVATSRLGECASRMLVCRILSQAEARGGLLLVFGGPRRGVVGEAEFDYIINTVPLQGVLTVRTEEALHATLAVFNVAREAGWCKDTL